MDGPSEGEAVAGTSQAKSYWDDVGCDLLFGKYNTYWYTLTETGASPDFSISETNSNTSPLYDLTCSKSSNTTSTASGSSGSSTSGSASGTVSSGFAVATSSSGSGSGGNSSVLGTNATLATTTAAKTASPTSGSGSSATSVTGSSGAVANTASFGGLLVAAALAIFVL